MKIARKQATMALLLFSVAAILPAYGNEEVIADNQEEVAVEQKEVETVWYKRPALREKARKGFEVALTIGTFGAICAFMGYMIFKGKQQDPFYIRLMNANIEVKKLCQNYKDDLQMRDATVWELPATHKDDFLRAVTAMDNKFGIRSRNEVYTLVDGSLHLERMIKVL